METGTSASCTRRPGAACCVLGARPRGPHQLALPGDSSDSRVSKKPALGSGGEGDSARVPGPPGPINPCGPGYRCVVGPHGGPTPAVPRPQLARPLPSTEDIQRGLRQQRGQCGRRAPGPGVNRSRVWECVPSGGTVLPHILGLPASFRIPSRPGPVVPPHQHWVPAAGPPTSTGLRTLGPQSQLTQLPGSMASGQPGQDPSPCPTRQSCRTAGQPG